ncbi:MAG: DUF4157 domain-containing protein [Gemmatimonadales bacterium]|nr:MAG: DUF4157 domain-containing protein [Gemmatimonadales bacterium]
MKRERESNRRTGPSGAGSARSHVALRAAPGPGRSPMSVLQRHAGNRAVGRMLHGAPSEGMESSRERSSHTASLVSKALLDAGRPLDRSTRAFMEARFGRDFGGVRVHTGPRAASSARALDALAYTLGERIVFARGEYAPHASSGRRLLAHELGHVLQQTGPGPTGVPQSTPVPSGLPVSAPGDLLEREAHRIADEVLRGPARVEPPVATRTSPLIQRTNGTGTATVLQERIADARRALTDTVWDHAEGWHGLRSEAATGSQELVDGIEATLERFIRWAGDEDQALLASLESSWSRILVGPVVGRVIGEAVPGVKGKVIAFGAGVFLGHVFREESERRLADAAEANRFLADLGVEGARRSMDLVREYGQIMHDFGGLKASILALVDERGTSNRLQRIERDLGFHERAVLAGREGSGEAILARCDDALAFRAEYLDLVRRFRQKTRDLRAINERIPAGREEGLRKLRERYGEMLATETGTQRLRGRQLVGRGQGIHLRGEVEWSREGPWGTFRISAGLRELGGIPADRLTADTRAHLAGLTPLELSRMGEGGAAVKLWLREVRQATRGDLLVRPGERITVRHEDGPFITWQDGRASVHGILIRELRQMTAKGFLANFRGPSADDVATTVVSLIESVPVRTLEREGREHTWS